MESSRKGYSYFSTSSIELFVETVMSLLVKSVNWPHIMYDVFLFRHISLRSKQILILAFFFISRSLSVTCPAVTSWTLAVNEHFDSFLSIFTLAQYSEFTVELVVLMASSLRHCFSERQFWQGHLNSFHSTGLGAENEQLDALLRRSTKCIAKLMTPAHLRRDLGRLLSKTSRLVNMFVSSILLLPRWLVYDNSRCLIYYLC